MSDAKVAVITAGGGGMGAAVARELHQCGYEVALMSRSEAAEELALELGGLGVRGSVTDAQALEAAAGRLSISRHLRHWNLNLHCRCHAPCGQAWPVMPNCMPTVTRPKVFA